MLSLPSLSVYQNAIPLVFVAKIKLITVDKAARVSWTFRSSTEHSYTKNSFSDVIITQSGQAGRLINYATVSSSILYFIKRELPTFKPGLVPRHTVRVTIILVLGGLGGHQTKTSPKGDSDNITEVLHRRPTSAVCPENWEKCQMDFAWFTPVVQALPGLGVMISGINQIKVLNNLLFVRRDF